MSYSQELFLAIFPSLLTGVMLAVFSVKLNRTAKRRDAAEKNRVEEAKLNLDITFATAQLAYAIAMAMKRGHPNGEVEEAVDVYVKALSSYREFERERMADTMRGA